jgi:excisionase family DNA binding protein
VGEPDTTERLALTIPEAARRLGISKNHAYLSAQKGDLPTFRIGGRVLVSVDSLNKIMGNGNKR